MSAQTASDDELTSDPAHRDPGSDPILAALAEARERWCEHRDAAGLRRKLIAILSMVEALEVP